MYFDEGTHLNQQHGSTEARNQVHPHLQRGHEFARFKENDGFQTCRQGGLASTTKGAPSDSDLLDATNNQLQGIMQMLYLLSRDTAVPTEVRYHVTLAQSEIALLARQMQNAANTPLAKDQAHLPQP